VNYAVTEQLNSATGLTIPYNPLRSRAAIDPKAVKVLKARDSRKRIGRGGQCRNTQPCGGRGVALRKWAG